MKLMNRKLLLVLFLVLGIGVGVTGIKDKQNLSSRAASTCSGTWSCKKGASNYTYQCSNFNGMTETTCTGGGNGQGNYCVTGWNRENGCAWSGGSTPTPTPTPTPSPQSTPTPTPAKKLSTPNVHCQSWTIPQRNGGKRRWMDWWWDRITGVDFYEVLTDIDPDRAYNKVQPSAYPGISMEVARKGTYTARVRALGAGYQPSDYNTSSCSVQ